MEGTRPSEGRGRVSIIVPVYNAEGCLDRCMESIVGQTYANIEIVLVNDGSTDSSEAVCRRWADVDERVKVISQKNAGPSAARNTGLRCSNGEWVWFVDSDDRVVPTSVEVLIARATEANADVAVCNFDVVDEDGVHGRDFVGMRPFPGDDDVGSERFLGDVMSRSIGNYVWQFLIKRTILDALDTEGPFDESLVLYEDVVFSLRLAAAADRFAYVDDICYHYHMTQGSLVHTTDPQLARQAIKAVDYLEGLSVPDSLAAARLESCLTLLLGAGITAGTGDEARAVHAEIRARINVLRRRREYSGVSLWTRAKCAAVKGDLYWRVRCRFR